MPGPTIQFRRLKHLLIAFTSLFLTIGVLAGVSASSATATGAPVVITASPSGSGSACTRSHPCKLSTAKSHARVYAAISGRDVQVVLLGGTYRVTKPLQFSSADSGRGKHSVSYVAASGATPVISGGRLVSGWKVSDSKKRIYRAKVGAAAFRDLYVDGRRAVRARGPMNPAGVVSTADGYSLPDSTMSAWKDTSAMEAVARIYWKELRCPVANITGTQMTFKQPCWKNANLHSGLGMQNVAWFENAYELLDSAGEWYYSKPSGYLYYKPLPGQSMKTAKVTVPVAEQLVVVKGTADKPVENLNFYGINFRETTWNSPSSAEGYTPAQSGFRVMGENSGWASARTKWVQSPAAVSFRYAKNVDFSRNLMRNIGSAGLNLETGVQDANVSGNGFTDIGLSAIQLGGITEKDHHPAVSGDETQDLAVTNNIIRTAGAHYRDGVGIWAGYISDSRIEHNDLKSLPYSGISFGWGWGLFDEGGNPNYDGNGDVPVYDSPSNNTGNSVRWNRISDYMRELADGAGIYTLGNAGGSVVSDNYITDLKNPNYFGIYLDEGSSGLRLNRNVTCRTGESWLNVHASFRNVILHNFADVDEYKIPGTEPSVVDIDENSSGLPCQALPASIMKSAGLTPGSVSKFSSPWRALVARPDSADNEAPAKVSGLQVVASTSSRATLDWDTSTDNLGTTGYEVSVNGVVSYATEHPGVTLGRLTAGKSIDISVRARDAAGNLSKDRTITFDVPEASESDTTPPTAPSNLRVAGAGTSSIVLEWSPSEDLVGVEKYEVTVGGHEPITTNKTSVAVPGLEADASFDVKVVAMDAADNTSAEATIAAETKPVPARPEALDLPGLVLWLDRGSVTAGDGDRVAVWSDSSGSGHDAAQATENARPLLDAAGDGSRGALEFNGASRLLETGEPVTDSQQYTVAVVSTVDTDAWGPFYNGDSSFDGYGFYKLQTSLHGTIHGGSGFNTYGPVENAGQVQVQTIVGSAGEERMYVDGAQSGNAATTSPKKPTRSTLIGAVDRFAPFAGDIAEVVVFDRALSSEELQSVNDFLINRHS